MVQQAEEAIEEGIDKVPEGCQTAAIFSFMCAVHYRRPTVPRLQL